MSVSGSSLGHWSTRDLAPARSSSPYLEVVFTQLLHNQDIHLIAACSFCIEPWYSGASTVTVTFMASS